MRKLMRFIRTIIVLALVLAIAAAAAAGALVATGTVGLDQLLGLLPFDTGLTISSLEEGARNALDKGVQLYSQLADHKPPTGDGEKLEGDLPEDLLPQAEQLYSFPEEKYPYRAMLGEGERAAYDQVYAYAVAVYERLPLHAPLSVASLGRVMNAVFYDHPELFWVDTDYRYSYLTQDNVVAVTLSFNETAGDIERHREIFRQAVEPVVAGALALDTAVEREKYVHDYLLDHVDYQLDAPLNQSAYSALVYGQSVCAGYSRAFQHILLELDIPCYYAAGYAGENHAWNIVGLDDGYYHVDVTWDDPLGNESGQRYYSYFNLTDSQMEEDHTRTDLSLNLPACTATGYSYANTFGGGYDAPPPGMRTPEEAGIYRSYAITSLEEYYTACEDRLVQLGTGTHTFSLLLEDNLLLEAVFQATNDGRALERYGTGAAQRLELNGYSANVSLQGEALSDGYWLLTQQIHLEAWEVDDSAPVNIREEPPARRDEGEQDRDTGHSGRESSQAASGREPEPSANPGELDGDDDPDGEIPAYEWDVLDGD